MNPFSRLCTSNKLYNTVFYFVDKLNSNKHYNLIDTHVHEMCEHVFAFVTVIINYVNPVKSQSVVCVASVFLIKHNWNDISLRPIEFFFFFLVKKEFLIRKNEV